MMEWIAQIHWTWWILFTLIFLIIVSLVDFIFFETVYLVSYKNDEQKGTRHEDGKGKRNDT